MLLFIPWRVPSAAPDRARAGGHGAAVSCLVLSGGGASVRAGAIPLLAKSRVNALCVISRAREAEPSAVGSLAPAAERGAAFFCFGLSAVVRSSSAL